MEIGIKATVSGSFRRAMPEVQAAVYALVDAGVQVLSPADPRIVDQFGEFLFVASDRQRSIRIVQDRHFDAISRSDFVWLVAPSGYVGASAAMEIGYAHRAGVPIYAETPPNDLTFRQYINLVPNVTMAVARAINNGKSPIRPANKPTTLLLDPTAALAYAHQKLDLLHGTLATRSNSVTEDLPEFRVALGDLRRIMDLDMTSLD
jgi:hypothetical protein